MHLAVLLFLTGVASAYPLNPAQASRLVPRDLPQPHCFRPMPDGTLPVLDPPALMAMTNCMRKADVVGFLRRPPKRLQDYRQIWRNKQGEPPECVIPMDKNNYEQGFCFVCRKPPAPPANQPPQPPPQQPLRPILPRPPEANAAPPLASQANAARRLVPILPRPQMNPAAQAPPPPHSPLPPPQHPPVNVSPQAGRPSHGQTSPTTQDDSDSGFPTTVSRYSDWGFPPR